MLGGLTGGLLGQTPPSSQEMRIALDVTRVSILATVSDKRGRFITGLAQQDFEILESQRLQQILGFQTESGLPLRLVVLIDTSNSVRDRFRFIQEAAISFLVGVIRGEDRVAVIAFDSLVEAVAGFEDDPEKASTAIRDLKPGRGTSFYDALEFACRSKLTGRATQSSERRIILILSDGEDSQSRVTRDQALEAVHRADAVLYAISTNMGRTLSDGDKVLKYFAEETGGRVLSPFRVEELSQSFETLAESVRRHYNLLYRPDPLVLDGRFHPIEVRIKGRRDLVVRARKGYYAPRPRASRESGNSGPGYNSVIAGG
jgi:VWFA-related protein